ncbi:hypothetical protein D3C87_2019260 [compost metagenome]
MVNEPVDMIMPMLREMRGEMREMRDELNQRFVKVEQQLDKLESGQKTIRQAL